MGSTAAWSGAACRAAGTGFAQVQPPAAPAARRHAWAARPCPLLSEALPRLYLWYLALGLKAQRGARRCWAAPRQLGVEEPAAGRARLKRTIQGRAGRAAAAGEARMCLCSIKVMLAPRHGAAARGSEEK